MRKNSTELKNWPNRSKPYNSFWFFSYSSVRIGHDLVHDFRSEPWFLTESNRFLSVIHSLIRFGSLIFTIRFDILMCSFFTFIRLFTIHSSVRFTNIHGSIQKKGKTNVHGSIYDLALNRIEPNRIVITPTRICQFIGYGNPIPTLITRALGLRLNN